ncbi:MAG: ATP-binding protein [Candidatus Poribacteria bacterium]|nr:ATP-binding protein [Candidatus Poribacteria bacterium]|tara:strand:- start:1540 stop:3510 length:1971 start_codon:yes stop_codon:yes gene_type:complete
MDTVDRLNPLRFKSVKTWCYLQLVCLFPFLLFFLVRDFDLIHLIELKTLDARLRLITPDRAHPKLRLISIDEKSQSENGIGPLPWAAYIYQTLIDSISAAEAIAIIMRFNQEWDVVELDKVQPIDNLFLIQTYVEFNQSQSAEGLPTISSWAELPNSFSRLTNRSSFSRYHRGSTDGVYRSAQLVLTELPDQHYQYSIEIHLLCQSLGVSISQVQLKQSWWKGPYLQIAAKPSPISIPISTSGRCFFPYLDNNHYPTSSFVDILKSVESGQQFTDKIALIGVASNNQPTAQTTVGAVTALGLRANLMNALLCKRYVWQMTPLVTGCYFAIFCILLFVIASWSYHLDQQQLFIIGLMGLLMGHGMLAILLLTLFQIWVNITALSLSILSAGILTILLLGYLRLRSTLIQLQLTQQQLVRSEKEAVFGIMAARVRHELRNALNLVQAPLEMVKNNFRKGDPLKFKQKPDLIVSEMDSAITALSQLDQMIERDLSFFQNQSLDLTACSLELIIESALEATRSLVEDNRIRVKFNYPDELPTIVVDQNQFQLALINLMKNACQSMLTGGTLTLSVTQKTASDKISISIRDTGYGISPHDLNRIFEAFYTTKPKGLGLGLLNAKNIVEAHGGQIFVSSQIQQGTEFTICLLSNNKNLKYKE